MENLFEINDNNINFKETSIVHLINKTIFFSIPVSKEKNYLTISFKNEEIVKYVIPLVVLKENTFLHCRIDWSMLPDSFRLMGELSKKIPNKLEEIYKTNKYPKAQIIFENVYLNKNERKKYNKENFATRGLIYNPHHYVHDIKYYCCLCNECLNSFFVKPKITSQSLNSDYSSKPIKKTPENTKNLLCPHCQAVYVDYQNNPNKHIEGHASFSDNIYHYEVVEE